VPLTKYNSNNKIEEDDMGGEMKSSYKILMRQPEEKRQTEQLRYT
jgi:hypothetical protein